MKNALQYTIVLLIIGLLSFISCKDDFTTDSSYRLTYSTDTLKFDTLISEVLSSTKILMIYNQTEKDLCIGDCHLNSQRGNFQINLDGQSGTNFQNIDIHSGDSLYLFVQFYGKQNNQDSALYSEDYIIFSYNGNMEKVVLTSVSQDVHTIRDSIISTNTTWTREKPYHIFDSLRIAEDATLTIEQGTRLYFHKGATLTVGGKLICNGTLESPIIFRGDRFDKSTEKYYFDQLNNQWGGVRIKSTSTGNQLTYTHIRNGNFGVLVDSAAIDKETKRLVIANSSIHNVSQAALRCHASNVYVYNSLFTCASNGCIVLEGGEYTFNHCTIGNYKASGIRGYGLTLSDKKLDPKGAKSPLMAAFNNCIIYGRKNNEIDFIYDNLDDTYQFRFDHCLIKQDSTGTEALTEGNCFANIWNETPDFLVVNTDEELYNFHLDSLSAARYKGFTAPYTLYPECETDKDGQSRLTDSLPDLGAYQFVSAQE